MPTRKKESSTNTKKNPRNSRLRIQRRKKGADLDVKGIKKFSPSFAYSIAALLVLAGLLFVSIFVFFLRNQANEQKIKTIPARPSVCEGWQNPQGAQEIEITGSGTAQEFSISNSAYLKLQPATGEGEQDFGVALGEPISITCSQFSYPNSDQFSIRGATLEISLSTEVASASGDILTLEYSLDGKTWTTLASESLTQSRANKERDGYVRYSLPFELIESHLGDLQVRYTLRRLSGENETRVFLDGVRLVLDAQKKLAIPDLPTDVVRMAKLEYQLGEQPTFAIHVDTKRGIPLLQKRNERTVTGIELVDPTQTMADQAVQLASDSTGAWEEYSIDPKQFSKPGKYSLRIHINEGGEEKIYTQEFSWGVLAINTDKSTYTPGERAEFSIGVLDDIGDIVCDADVELQITDPLGAVTKLSTDDGSISVTDACYQKKEFERPDYLAGYEIREPGVYQYALSASHHNGVFGFSDTFLSTEPENFSVQRYGPTRVFPKVWQPMELRVTAYQDYAGVIKDVVPDGFQIEESSTYRVEQVSVEDRVVQEIIWDTNLTQGQSSTFGYRFKPPEVSPAFYVIGQAEIGDWQENRVWQLAVDPTYMYLLANTGSGVASGWVLDTGSDGNYLRAASTAGGTGGSATHTHTFTETVGSASATVDSIFGFGTARSSDTHTHTSSGTSIGAANNDPANYTFYLWKYNTADATPPSVPDNVFAFFEDADVGGLSGDWSEFSSANNKLIKINNSHTSGGSDTHTHAITWGSLGAASGTDTGRILRTGSTPWFPDLTHTHTAPSSSNTSSETSVPSYSTLRLYEQTNATPPSLPTGMIALFDGTPPSGWTTISNSSPYQDTYIRATGSSGSTGGSSSHSHSNANGVTGGPSGTTDATSAPPAGSDFASPSHTHTITLSSFSSPAHDPPYENYILASYDGATGIDISGNVLGTDESSFIGNPPCDGSTANVAVRVNGGSVSTTSCNASTGAYSFTGISASAGDTITIYLTGETEKANLVLISGGSNITGADLYESRVIVRDDDNGTLSILDMLDYDNDQNATDMIFDADDLATDTLSVESGYELHIWAGDTFDPNGTVTTNGAGDLHVEGTAYLDTATNTIGNNITVDSGATLYIQQSTTVTGGTNGGISTAGTLTISGGTNTIGNGTDEDLTVTAGATTISGGTLNVKDDVIQSGGTLNVTTTVNINGSGGSLLNITGGTYTIGSGGNVTISSIMQVDGASAVANLNGGTTTSSSHFYFNQGSITLAGGNHYTGTNSYLYLANSAATTFNMTGGHAYTAGLLVSSAGTLTTTTVTGGTIHIGQIVTTNFYYDISASSHSFYNIQIDEDASFHASSTADMKLNGGVIISSGKTFTANSKQIYIDNDSSGDGIWTNNGGTFTPGTGTVTMKGGQINGSGDTTFYNLTIDPTTSGTVTVDTDSGADDPTVSGTLNVASGDTLAIEANRQVTHTGGTFTLSGTISGAGRMAFTSTSPGPGTGGTLSSVVRYDVTSANIASTTFDARTYGGNVEVYSSSGSVRQVTMANSATYTFNGSLYIQGDGAGNATISDGSSTTVNIANDLDFIGSGGGTEQILFGANSVWTISGNVDFSNGAIFANSTTLQMNGSSKSIYGNGQTLYNFTVTGTFPTITVASNLTVSNTLTMNASIVGGITVSTSVTLTLASTGSLSFTGSQLIDGFGTYIHKPATFPSTGSFNISNLRFDVTSNNITVAGSRSFGNESGDTVEFYNSGATARSVILGNGASQTITFNAAVASTITGAGGITVDPNTNDAALVFNYGVTLASNTSFTASNSATLDIKGNWANSGTFTHNNGTARLSGTGTQAISGNLTSSNAFYTLQVTNSSGSAVTINSTLQAANSFSIPQGGTLLRVNDAVSIGGGNFSVAGSSGNEVTLRSTSDGNQWDMIFTGTLSADYVDVKDSNACSSTNQPVAPTNSTDSGNNDCWAFIITISGTSDLGSGTVRVAVNGTLDVTHTGTISGGSWSIANVTVATDDVVTVWVDAQLNSNEATGISIADGSSPLAGFVLNTNVVTVGHSGTSILDLADFALYDADNDEDILFTSNASVLDIDGGGPYASEKIKMLANTQLTVSTGETLSTHDLEIASSGVLDASGTPAFNLSGTLTNAGYFTSDAETWTFTSNTTETINLTGASDYDMVNMTFNNASGNWSINRGLLITNDLTVTSGTLTLNNDTTVYGDVTGAGTITTTSGTPIFSVPTGSNTFGTSGTWTFYDLKFPHSGLSNYTTTATGSGNINVTHVFTLDGTYNVNNDTTVNHILEAGSLTFNLSGTGTPFVIDSGGNNSAFSYQTSTVNYTGTGSAVTPRHLNYYNVSFDPSSTTTYNLTALTTLSVYNNFIIDANASVSPSTSTIEMKGTSGVLEGGDQDLYKLVIDPTSAGTITVQNSDVHVTNDLTVSSGDTLSIASGTVVFAEGSNDVLGTGTVSGAGAIRFYSTSGGPGTTITTYTSVVQFDAGNGNVGPGTMDTRTYAGDVEIIKSNNAAYGVEAGSGTYTIGGDLKVIDTSSITSIDLDLYTNNPDLNIGGSISFPGPEPFASLSGGSGTYTVSGDVDFSNGDFYEGTSTIDMDGTGYLDTNAQNLYNLTLSGSTSLNSDVEISHDLTMTGSVTPNTNTVTMSGTSGAIIGGNETLYNLTINPSSTGTISLKTTDLSVSNNLNVASSDALSIDPSVFMKVLSSASLTLSGTVSGSGTLEYQPSAAFPSGGTISATLFYNNVDNSQTMTARTYQGNVEVGCDGSNIISRTVTAQAGTLTVQGNLSLIDGSCTNLTTLLMTANPTTTVNGDLSIENTTTLSAPASLTVKGDYANAGNFTDNSGEVIFAGTSTQTLSGQLTGSGDDFYDLSITNTSGSVTGCDTSFTAGVSFAASADITHDFEILTTPLAGGVNVEFNSGSTYTVNRLNLVGASGKEITLRNSNLTSGTWAFNVTTQIPTSLSYVNVARSDASGGIEIDASDGTNTDCNNNTNWKFVAGIDISGNIYTDEGTSLLDCTTSRTVNVRVNGSGSDTVECSNTPTNGSYAFTGISVTSGDVVTLYLDNETEEATTVYITDETNQTNVDLYQDWVIVRADTGSITNANLSSGDDADDDIKYTVSGGDVTIDSGFGLHVWSGDTFAPGGAVTTTSTGTAAGAAGDVHIDTSATLNMTDNSALSVGGDYLEDGNLSFGITQVTTFTATGSGFSIDTAGAVGFNDLTLNGSGGTWTYGNTDIVQGDLTVSAGTLTGSNNLTVNGSVTGAGTLNFTGGTFTHGAETSTNFGTSSGSNNWTFNNLSMTNGSGGTTTITLSSGGTGSVVVNGDFSGSVPTSGTLAIDNETNDRAFDIAGNVTIGSNVDLQASSTAAFTLEGDWTNNGAFTSGSGTVTLDGAAQQTLSGQMTGTGDDFYNLTITNASGASPDIIFAASADVGNTLLANTASSEIQYLAGGTYTFQNIDFDGQAEGTRIRLTSSSPGTQWDLAVAGTRSVSNTYVRDSNACPQSPDIDASDGTNFDATNNDCWLINSVTFSISDNTIGFGTSTASASRYATGDTTGSASETEAHTLSASTNAENGYTITVYGPTLTSGAQTITAIGGSNTAATPGAEQFGLRMTASGGSGSVSAPYDAAGFAYDAESAPDIIASSSVASAITTYSVRYLVNISSTTEPGTYAANLTFVLTSQF